MPEADIDRTPPRSRDERLGRGAKAGPRRSVGSWGARSSCRWEADIASLEGAFDEPIILSNRDLRSGRWRSRLRSGFRLGRLRRGWGGRGLRGHGCSAPGLTVKGGFASAGLAILRGRDRAVSIRAVRASWRSRRRAAAVFGNSERTARAARSASAGDRDACRDGLQAFGRVISAIRPWRWRWLTLARPASTSASSASRRSRETRIFVE